MVSPDLRYRLLSLCQLLSQLLILESQNVCLLLGSFTLLLGLDLRDLHDLHLLFHPLDKLLL